MMMNAFWWEFIKMKVKLGILRIIDLNWYRTMGPASCFQIDDHLLKNREKWCFNSGKIHAWHSSWRGWAFWWLRSSVCGQEAWLKLELFRNLWLFKKTYTCSCLIRNTRTTTSLSRCLLLVLTLYWDWIFKYLIQKWWNHLNQGRRLMMT